MHPPDTKPAQPLPIGDRCLAALISKVKAMNWTDYLFWAGVAFVVLMLLSGNGILDGRTF